MLTGDETIDAALKGQSETTVVANAAKAGEVYFDCEIGNGICGVLAEPPVIWYTPLDAVVSAPVRPFGVFTDVPANNVLTLVYRGPAVHPHQSKLLDGVRLDESILSAQDLIPRKQRVGRGQLNILEISQSTRSAEARGFGTDTMGVGPTGRVEYDSYGRVRSAGQGLMANSNFFQGGGNNFGDQRAMGESNSYSGRGGYGGSYPDQGRYNQLPPDRRGYDDRGYPPADRSYSGRSYPQNDSRDQGGRYGQQSNPPTGGGGGYSGYQYSGYEGAGRDPPRSAGGYGYGAPQQSYQRPDLGGGYPPGPGYNRPNSYAHSAPPSRGYEGGYDSRGGAGRASSGFSHSSSLGPRAEGATSYNPTCRAPPSTERAPMQYSGSRNQDNYRPAPTGRTSGPALSTFSARNTNEITPSNSLASSAALLRGPGVFPVAPAAPPPPRQSRDPRLRK